MSERVWHKGPPPFPGWWESSPLETPGAWRWWNGNCWSLNCRPNESTREIKRRASFPSLASDVMAWTDYWPENARVPRLDPTGGHWTFNVDGVEPSGLPDCIDLVFRTGEIRRNSESGFWRWGLTGQLGDILAWRPAA